MNMQAIDAPRRSVRARRVKDPVSGFSHLFGLVSSLVAVPFLVGHALARSDWGTLATSVAYGVSLVLLYAASSVYHLVIADDRVTRWLRLLDHAAIFLLIAGTSTPIFYRAFDGATRTVMLAIVWTFALLGIVLKVLWTSAPRLFYTALYVAMGWLIVVRFPVVAEALPPVVLGLVTAGGITYTIGALVYATKRPNPFPRVFGFHEIWHMFVLGGSTLHFVAIATLVS